MDEDRAAVATALNKRMLELRLSQQELAERSGVSVSTLRLMQRGAEGRRWTNRTLAAVSTALDWPADYMIRILRGEDPPPPRDASGAESLTLVLDRLDELQADVRRLDRRLDDLSQQVQRGSRPRTPSG
ncbi:MAG: helix-turn-helix domain-containing protein [Nocardioidaceae bacterium]